MSKKILYQVMNACVSFFIGAQGVASSILIAPVDPVIESHQQATALWLQNQGTLPVVMQIQVVNWQQKQFDDHYQDAQQSLIASPPIATVLPGKRQLIRLVRGQMGTPGKEEAFRLIIDEVPPVLSNASEVKEKREVGVQFQMRYSVPLFVAGEGIRLKEDSENKILATAPRLSAQLVNVAGKKYLQIANQGNVHARLSHVVWHQGVKNVVLSTGLLGYVLPGAQMRWLVPINISSEGALTAQINDVNDVPIPLS
jgi:fimbrial chaperone protein